VIFGQTLDWESHATTAVGGIESFRNSRAGAIFPISARSAPRRKRCEHCAPSANLIEGKSIMATKRKQERRRQQREKISRFELADTLPIVGEFKDCRQLTADHWQGVDIDGTIIDVTGCVMPPYLIIDTGQWRPLPNEWGFMHYGIIRLTRA
jgi:hypothetical protein